MGSITNNPRVTGVNDVYSRAEGFGASPGASAAANVSAIQEALNRTGLVTLTVPGTYSTNATLLQGSNTKFVLGPGAKIQLASLGANLGVPILTTTAYAVTPTAVTLTYTSGSICSVAWTAHGLAVGDYVWLSGSTPTMFNGVFHVNSITDANNFVVGLISFPSTTPSGSALAVKANVNVFVEGGIWDYNSNTATSALNRHAVILGVAQNVHAKDMVINNAQKYCLHFGAVRAFSSKNISSTVTASDLIKVYGPAFHGRIESTHGYCGDDGVSVQAKEAAAFAASRWTFGDMIDVVIDGVDIQNGNATAGVVVYCSASEITTGIKVTNVTGFPSSEGVRVSGPDASAVAGSIEIDNVSANGNYLVRVTGSVSVNDLSARRLSGNARAVSSNFFFNDSTGTHKKISIDLGINDSAWGASGGPSAIVMSGSANLLEISGAIAAGSTGRCLSITAGTIKKVVWKDYTQETGDNCLVIGAGITGTPQFDFIGCDLKTTAIANVSSSCVVTLANNRIESATNGVIRTGGTPTVTVRSNGGNNLVSGTWFVVPSGTPVFDAIIPEMQVPWTMATSAGGLAEGTNNATVKTVNTISYQIAGKFFSKVATDNIAITASTVQAISTSRIYVVQLDTSGNFTVVQGGIGAVFPPATAGKCQVGAFKVVTDGATTYTPGTTDNSAAGLTVTYVDLATIPQSLTM